MIYQDKRKPLILLVHDKHEMHHFFSSGLSEGNSVEFAYGEEGARNFLNDFVPDLILTNVFFPPLYDVGFDFPPFIFLADKTDSKHEMVILKLGAIDVIFPPYNIKKLEYKIQNLLRSKSRLSLKNESYSAFEPRKIKLSSPDEDFLKNIVGLIDKHIDDSALNAEKLSEGMNMSANSIYRKLKFLTGQGVKRFIQIQRMKVAADLLMQQKRNVSEIIYLVGFSEPSYFSSCFKKYYGCTPTDFIKKNTETQKSLKRDAVNLQFHPKILTGTND